MSSVSEILREWGLPPPPAGEDHFYSLCPKCSRYRSTAEHRRSPVLGVRIHPDRIVVGCNHCQWTACKYFEQKNGNTYNPTVARFDYQDETGAVIARKNKTAKGTYWWQRPDGHGGWVKGLGGLKMPLYRLPELLEALANDCEIAIAEGEKDCDSLWRIGIPATCNPDGASEPGKAPKWRSEYSEVLRGANVLVFCDHDPPGYAHQEAIARVSTGISKRVRILKLADYWPACPAGGDISDWIKAGGAREQLDMLIDKAVDWRPAAEEPNAEKKAWGEGITSARDLCSMTFKPLKYVVPGVLPEGLTILASRPKLGKSWLLLQIGVCVSNGVEAVAQDYGLTPPAKGSVLLLALEDGMRRLQRRMTKMLGSANPDSWPRELYLKTAWRRFDQGGLDDIRAWHAFEKEQGRNPMLVGIDTLAKVRAPGSSKQSPYQQDHDALAALQRLTEELGIAVVVCHHDRKMAADDIFDTVSGTLGLTGAVDTILILTRRGLERTLHVRGRDIEEETSLAMSFSPLDCRWRIIGTAAERQERQQSAERTKILEVMEKHGAPMAVLDIMAATSMVNRHAVDILLGKMTIAGQIKRTGRGVYCHPNSAAKDGGDGDNGENGEKLH